MKIFLLAQSFPPPSAAGSVQYLSNIFGAFPPETVEVVTGNAQPSLAPRFDAGYPQRIHRFWFIQHVAYGYKTSKIARLIEYALWPLVTAWLLVRNNPKLIMIGEFNVTTIPALIAKRLLRKPYILFTYAEEITYFTTRPLYLRLLKKSLHHADAIITVSDYTSGILQELGADANRIYKVLPAVAYDKAVAASPDVEALRRRYSLMNSAVLLTVGRLVERKGHASVIDALPSILHSFPNTHYVIVGTGPEEDNLKQRVQRANLQDKVTFTGVVENDELACWYEICDVFLMPHRMLHETQDTEGCPTVFLEASAHGKPVIGGKDGGVADAILDRTTGFIIDGTNTSQISECVSHLLQDPELATRIGAAGRAYVETLAPESRAAAIQQIIQQVIKSNKELA